MSNTVCECQRLLTYGLHLGWRLARPAWVSSSGLLRNRLEAELSNVMVPGVVCNVMFLLYGGLHFRR